MLGNTNSHYVDSGTSIISLTVNIRI